MIEKVFR